MCAYGRCRGVWVAVHGINRRILAVGGRGEAGRKKALAEAKKRQKIYGPPGPIPLQEDVICRPMLDTGPAAQRIRKEMRELGAM